MYTSSLLHGEGNFSGFNEPSIQIMMLLLIVQTSKVLPCNDCTAVTMQWMKCNDSFLNKCTYVIFNGHLLAELTCSFQPKNGTIDFAFTRRVGKIYSMHGHFNK